ncbi:MAG TPA: hypothetical protein VN673_14730, partial [Clostridia bacterium]|nr:hypothetical protein [Clostridia bacterium]
PALNPSGSFVDVWTSINAFDYHDRQGGFHSKTETLRHWGEAFALIRDSFGGGPTTSEAGSDQLIGWLEGADCQFMQIGEGKPFNNVAPCLDWERVPWFDAVNHSRFSLHGVGYSSRYEGGRSRFDHGIESDDYISAEILTGHALMIDLPGMVRGAVRKYWLAQDFIESIAMDDVASVQYAGGNIHRQAITWKSGATVHVNRGSNDWHIANRVLPPYGYLAQNGVLQSSIERIDGAIVEQSRAPGHDYYNGRGYNPNAPLSIRPAAKYVEYLGAREFRLVVDWQADAPAPADLSVFYHFSRPTPGRYTDTEFYGGGKPQPPVSAWSGRVVTGTNWTVGIPPGMPLGEYDVLVGLYDPNGGKRYRLLGDETDGRRYLVGTLIVDGAVQAGATNITSVRLKKSALADANASPAINRSPVNFGSVITSGALRLIRDSKTLVFLPLPDGNDFTIECASGLFHGRKPQALHAIDPRGAALRPVPFTTGPTRFYFRVDKNDFGYRLDFTP